MGVEGRIPPPNNSSGAKLFFRTTNIKEHVVVSDKLSVLRDSSIFTKSISPQSL